MYSINSHHGDDLESFFKNPTVAHEGMNPPCAWSGASSFTRGSAA